MSNWKPNFIVGNKLNSSYPRDTDREFSSGAIEKAPFHVIYLSKFFHVKHI